MKLERFLTACVLTAVTLIPGQLPADPVEEASVAQIAEPRPKVIILGCHFIYKPPK